MNKQSIQALSILVDFLGKTLGPDYEISLYDLSDPSHSLAAIANSHITGKALGSPLPTILLHDLADITASSSDYRINYGGTSVGNKTLRTSSMYFRDDAGKCYAIMSIAFDDSRYQDISDRILKLCHPDFFVNTNFLYNTENPETPKHDISGYPRPKNIDELIAQYLSKNNLQADRLTHDGKFEIIRYLESNGVFQMRGAVKELSEKLACSVASIYRYLAKIRKDS